MVILQVVFKLMTQIDMLQTYYIFLKKVQINNKIFKIS